MRAQNRGWTIFIGDAQNDGGTRRDVGTCPQISEQLLQGPGAGHTHFQDVVVIARDAVARLDCCEMCHTIGDVIGVAVVDRRDRDKRGQRQPDGIEVNDSAIPDDDTALLETSNALMRSRCGQASVLGEVGVAHSSVTAQQLDDLPVVRVQVIHAVNPIEASHVIAGLTARHATVHAR